MVNVGIKRGLQQHCRMHREISTSRAAKTCQLGYFADESMVCCVIKYSSLQENINTRLSAHKPKGHVCAPKSTGRLQVLNKKKMLAKEYRRSLTARRQSFPADFMTAMVMLLQNR